MPYEDLFKTVYASAYSMAQAKNLQAEQYRREAQARNDMLNAQTNQALLGTLRELTAMQKNDLDARKEAARTLAKATGEPAPTSDPRVALEGQVGQALNQRENEQRDFKALQEQQLRIMQERGAMARTQATVGGAMERQLQQQGWRNPQWQAEQNVRLKNAESRRISATRPRGPGAAEIAAAVSGAISHGGDKVLVRDAYNRALDASKGAKTIGRLKERLKDSLPDQNLWTQAQASMYGIMDRLGKDIGEEGKAILHKYYGNKADLALARLELLKPLLGVMTGKDYEIAEKILGQLGDSLISGSPEQVMAQLDRIEQSYRDSYAEEFELSQRGGQLRSPEVEFGPDWRGKGAKKPPATGGGTADTTGAPPGADASLGPGEYVPDGGPNQRTPGGIEQTKFPHGMPDQETADAVMTLRGELGISVSPQAFTQEVLALGGNAPWVESVLKEAGQSMFQQLVQQYGNTPEGKAKALAEVNAAFPDG